MGGHICNASMLPIVYVVHEIDEKIFYSTTKANGSPLEVTLGSIIIKGSQRISDINIIPEFRDSFTRVLP
jgi:hypothetical protein